MHTASTLLNLCYHFVNLTTTKFAYVNKTKTLGCGWVYNEA